MSLVDSRRWLEAGTKLLDETIGGLTEPDYDGPSLLPGWTRKHLLAHLCANAVALGNLVHWAATGERTPMYTSPEQRAADIETGSRLSAAELHDWYGRSATTLTAAMDQLTDEQWQTEVLTAQGRPVPATTIPWLRAREVMVHAVDLGTGVTFDDLPDDFLIALCGDITAKRTAAGDGPALVVQAGDTSWTVAGQGDPTTVTGSLAGVAAYLAGRGSEQLSAGAPRLPAWL
jgi:maleylpyruvate isomerase